jgi:hypothetical protein
MKGLFLPMMASAALLLAPASASPAMAATTTAVHMTFDENVAPGNAAGCAVLANGTGVCGHGEVIPYGQAAETIVFGVCGGNCDVRTITLVGGEVTLNETASNTICPGVCQPNPGKPFSATITDVIVAGTGQFAGASGNLSGSVTHAGANAVIHLSGTITLP